MGSVFDPAQSSQDDETNNLPDRDHSNTELHNTCTTEHVIISDSIQGDICLLNTLAENQSTQAQGPAPSQAAPMDQPEFTPLTSTSFKWAAVAGEDFCRDID